MEKKSKKGVDFGVRNVNEDQLSRYKKLKERTKGDSQRAFKKLENANRTNINEAKNFESIANSRAQEGRAIVARSYQNRVKQNQAPSSAPATKTVNQTTTNAAKDTVKTAAKESTQKAAPVMNQVNKNGSGMLKKGIEWAGRHKVGLGIAAGTTALAGGGAYLYNKAKKKDQAINNN